MTTLKNKVLAMREAVLNTEKNNVLEQIKSGSLSLFELDPFRSVFYIKFADEPNLEIDEYGDLVLTVSSKLQTDEFRADIAEMLSKEAFFADCEIVNESVMYICITL